MPWFEFAGNLEKLVCHFRDGLTSHNSPSSFLRWGFCFLRLLCIVNMMCCFLINTPLDPSQLPIRSVQHPTLLETWSRQGLVVNALRTRCREPLRSVSHHLGFAINSHLGILATGSWWVRSRSRCLQDPLGCSTAPGSLLGRNFVGTCPHQASITLRLTSAFPEGHSGRMSLSHLT